MDPSRLSELVKVPGHHDKVFKDECMFCFKDAFSKPEGLFISLKDFQAYCSLHVHMHCAKHGTGLYLNEKATKVPIEEPAKDDAPTVMAIGVEGGFETEKQKFDVVRDLAVVLLPDGKRYLLPDPSLPEGVLTAIAAVEAHESASKQTELATWQEDRQVSKYAATLEQLPCGAPISMDPSDWRCEESGETTNLWLNLGTGHIGSGRQHWDGSGGNGAAMRHYEATGKKFPLVVKLGTITPSGADVYSYASDEDDLVTDPLLREHLNHWGIDMSMLDKTDKSMAELQIEKNMEYEFDKITEAGSALQQLSGPGLVGLENLGNSCYMNTVLQVLWSIPELATRYVDHAQDIFLSAPNDIGDDFLTQFTKVGVALVTGDGNSISPIVKDGSKEDEANINAVQGMAVKPQAFKAVVGKGHQEFASARQQDAEEFLSYILESLARVERSSGGRLPGVDEPTKRLFEFQTVTRTQCSESNRVSYKTDVAPILGLQIPLHAAINKMELEEYKERENKRQRMIESGNLSEVQADTKDKVIPRVPFIACMENFSQDRTVENYFSAYLQRNTQAVQRVGFGSFPPYMIVQLRRYYCDESYTPKKLEVLVDVPESLSLEAFRQASEPQPGEELQPEEDKPTGVQPDDGIVQQLMAMGFSENGSKRAAIATGNSSAEAAMEWVFGHMEDPDFNDPVVASSGAPASGQVNTESVSVLTGMGFTEAQATAALKECQENVERAVDWLFSRADDLDAAVNGVLQNSEDGQKQAKTIDGRGDYQLLGFISHIGGNTACGHYVCHMKKDGKWTIFNDEKVAVSDNPPQDLGYIYIYKRIN